MTDYDYAVELKEAKVCRFCLAQNEPLTNIYSKENSRNSPVSLSMQIMACVSIEVSVDFFPYIFISVVYYSKIFTEMNNVHSKLGLLTSNI